MRILVIAAGTGSRWGDYRGVPKHLAAPEPGEAILHRTVRLFARHGYVIVVGPADPRYKIAGAGLYVPDLTPAWHDADKFLSSRHLWSRTERTVVAYGDVWFSNEAVDRIVGYSHDDWVLFGRRGGNDYTGSIHGECFAQSFRPADIDEHETALWRIVEAFQDGDIDRNGGWEHYRAMAGIPLDEHQIGSRFVEIHDWTEDFDEPEEFDRWVERRRHGRE